MTDEEAQMFDLTCWFKTRPEVNNIPLGSSPLRLKGLKD